MNLRQARWLAVPLASFAAVFGASFAYHSLAEDRPAAAAAKSAPGAPAELRLAFVL